MILKMSDFFFYQLGVPPFRSAEIHPLNLTAQWLRGKRIGKLFSKTYDHTPL